MRYQHDCDECRYVGEIDDADVYICPRTFLPNCRFGSLIMRYSSEGSDYTSMADFGNDAILKSCLKPAFELAIKKGFVKLNPDRGAIMTPQPGHVLAYSFGWTYTCIKTEAGIITYTSSAAPAAGVLEMSEQEWINISKINRKWYDEKGNIVAPLPSEKLPLLPSQDFDTLLNYGRLKRHDVDFDIMELDEEKLYRRLKTDAAREAFDVLRHVSSNTDLSKITNLVARRAITLR